MDAAYQKIDLTSLNPNPEQLATLELLSELLSTAEVSTGVAMELKAEV